MARQTTVSDPCDDTMQAPSCPTCNLLYAVTDSAVADHWIQRAGAKPPDWAGRLHNGTCLVCPQCDAYALGLEVGIGAPFYDHSVAAFLTVHDWDWWNADPAQCDIRTWPDFGCITFSKAAVQAAVEYTRAMGRLQPSVDRTQLAELAGFPAWEAPASEWDTQLALLKDRMHGEFDDHELEAAVGLLLNALLRATGYFLDRVSAAACFDP